MSTHTVSRTALWKVPLAGVFITLIVVSLTFLGLVILYSASRSLATDPTLLLRKQLIWFVIALVSCGIMMLINLSALRKHVYLLAGGSVLMLVLVLIPGIGVRINGAQRWIDLGPMLLQVSEIGKLGMLFTLAHYLAANRRYFDDILRGYIIPCGIMAVTCGLILIEPDFGTAFLCGTVGGLMLYLAGVRLKFLIPTGVAAIILFSIAVYNDPVRLQRITSFLDVEGNRSDGSYQLWQGILAFGAGGIEGVGLGAGRQQMAFLPDFIASRTTPGPPVTSSTGTSGCAMRRFAESSVGSAMAVMRSGGPPAECRRRSARGSCSCTQHCSVAAAG